jgi:hypothetical protein
MSEKEKLNPSNKAVRILISTQDYLINGVIYLPLSTAVDNPTTENLLFYALNCGNKFIALHDGLIMNKSEIEYKPENFKYYNINLDIVHSCRIIED